MKNMTSHKQGNDWRAGESLRAEATKVSREKLSKLINRETERLATDFTYGEAITSELSCLRQLTGEPHEI